MSDDGSSKKKVLILGAGFAGLLTAKRLQKKVGKNLEVTLLNKYPYHCQATLLYESAVGLLSDEQVEVSIDDVIDENKITFIQDTVSDLVVEQRLVKGEMGTYSYDCLVIALGFEAETFGIPGMKEFALGMTGIDSSRSIRRQIEQRFEHFNESHDVRDLTIVVGGAGFTGIQFIAELAERIPALCKHYGIDPDIPKIICVEAQDQILPGFDPGLTRTATRKLEKLGVVLEVGAAVKECFKGGIRVESAGVERVIEGNTVVWSAGVRGSSVVERSTLPSKRGRVAVNEYLQAPGFDEVFVAGDCALVINPASNRPYPPTAQMAMGETGTLAHNVVSYCIKGHATKRFSFKSKGTVCSLGLGDGVGVVFGMLVKGRVAAWIKNAIDNRWLAKIGGIGLVFKKGVKG